MAQKDRVVRRIDERPSNLITGGGQLIQQGEINIAPPNIPSAPEPENVTIGAQVLLRTTLVPKVAVQVTWEAPVNLIPEQYLIEYATDSTFTTNLLVVTTTLTRVALEMNTATDYWVRVRDVVRGIYSDYAYPSNYPAASVTTIDDTTAPNDVTGVSTDWTTGDLEIKWTNPSSTNYFDTRVRIYDTNGGTLYKEVYVPGGRGAAARYVFTAADNKQVTSNNPLTTVYYTIYARSIAHVLSPTGVTGNVTKAKPAKPTGLTSTWSGDDGTYDELVKFSWTGVTGASDYTIIIDGVSRVVYSPYYEYPYGTNVADHRPTLASGKPNLAYTVQASDSLGQISPGASGTATNVAPQSSNTALTTAAGFSSLYAYVTHTKDIQDFHHYRWLLTSGGSIARNVISYTPEITFDTLKGTYALSAYVTDKYGQTSNPVTVSGIVLDGLTIDELRSETQYTSSEIGDSQTNLNKLKDGTLSGQTGLSYTGNSTWKWILAARPLIDRYKTITIVQGVLAVSGPIVYVGLSTDGSTYRWFAGPLTTTGTTGTSTTATEYATEALAKTNAVSAQSIADNGGRLDLPAIMEARYVLLGHTGTSGTSNYNFQEFYPRRLIQTDDLQAETIKAINIAANTITADRLSVTQLSAITANIGQLVIDTTGYLWQGTGTAGSPTTGLKIYNSGGIGKLSTYNGGTEQIKIDTDGRLKVGAGNVVLDANGIVFAARQSTDWTSSLPTVPNAIVWKYNGAPIASMEGYYDNTDALFNSFKITTASGTAYSHIWMQQTSNFANIQMLADNGLYNSYFILNVQHTGNVYGNIYNAAHKHAFRVGNTEIITATISGAILSMAGGSKKFLKIDDTSASSDTVISLENSGNNISSGSFWIRAQKSSTDMFYVRGDGFVYSANSFNVDGGNAGYVFYDRSGSNVWQWYGTGDIARLYNGTADTIQISNDGSLSVIVNDAITNAASTALTLWHRTSGTATTNFGSNIVFNLESSTGSDRNAGLIQVLWTDATDTTRNSDMRFSAYTGNGATTTAREGFRIGATAGDVTGIGFFATAVAAKQTVTGSRGGNAALASLLTALATYGLVTDSSSA